MLRKFLLVSSSSILLTSASLAADLPPVAARVAPAIAQSWAGFYLGVHGGYGWGDNSFRTALPVDPFPAYGGLKSQGAIYGGQAGHNWQYGKAVTGLEIDWSVSDIEGSVAPVSVNVPQTGLVTVNRSDRTKYLGSARGRLGWLPVDNVLLYGTAGAAWRRIDERAVQAQAGNIGFDVTTPFDRVGWIAGVGVEAMPFGPDWIARLEYLHYDFGATQRTQSVVANIAGLSYADSSGRQTFDILRAGLSYKLGASGATTVHYAKAPAAPMASSWAGFYLGVHGGYGWGKNSFSSPVLTLGSFNGVKSSGGVYGGQAGYNWQFGRTVAGLELDFSATDVKGSTQINFFQAPAANTATWSNRDTYLGSLRGRLGWSPMDNVLLYGTAGLGWERFDRITTNTAVAPAGTSNIANYTSSDRFGWVAGAGVEAMLSGSSWIGRLEYLHYDFGAVENSGALVAPNFNVTASAGTHSLDVLRAGVSYKFGEPTPTSPVRYAKAPPIAVAPSHAWNGFYLGGHVGYGWKNDDFSRVINFQVPRLIDSIDSRGWLAGLHAGYTWQYGRLVAGLETDFSFSDISGTSAPLVQDRGGGRIDTDTLSDRVKFLASTRARLGWTPTDQVLLFATAGPAWERLERTQTTLQTGNLVQTTTSVVPSDRFGGVVGAGAEWMPLGSNWVGRIEYLHYDFGRIQDTTTFTSNMPGDVPYSEKRGRQTIETVRAGISYKFGSM